MSIVKIQGNASGTGTLTIAAPNTNSDRTLTLPDNTGTLLSSASALSATNLSGRVPAANAPLGSVVQVVQTFKNDFFSTTSVSPVDITGMSLSITPVSASNKILIMVHASMGGAQDTYTYLLLVRNSTVIGNATGATGLQNNVFLGSYFTNISSGQYMVKNVSNTFLDSPSTTSAVTYKVQLATPYNPYGAFASINRQQATDNMPYVQYSTSSITALEIAA